VARRAERQRDQPARPWLPSGADPARAEATPADSGRESKDVIFVLAVLKETCASSDEIKSRH